MVHVCSHLARSETDQPSRQVRDPALSTLQNERVITDSEDTGKTEWISKLTSTSATADNNKQ